MAREDTQPADLQNAILTKRQREYLLGDGYDGLDAERMARKRIRERLQASIFDISLIANELDLEDIDQAFTEPNFVSGDSVYRPFGTKKNDLITLLYLAYREREQDGPHDGWYIEQMVESGIKRALTRIGVNAKSISVDIEVERGSELDSHIDENTLSELPQATLQSLLNEGKITHEQFAEAILEQQESE